MMTFFNKILIWNRCGAESIEFYRYCKHYLVMTKFDIVVTMDTRMNLSNLRITFFLLGYDGFEFSKVRGYASGIIVAQKKNVLGVQILCKKL